MNKYYIIALLIGLMILTGCEVLVIKECPTGALCLDITEDVNNITYQNITSATEPYEMIIL